MSASVALRLESQGLLPAAWLPSALYEAWSSAIGQRARLTWKPCCQVPLIAARSGIGRACVHEILEMLSARWPGSSAVDGAWQRGALLRASYSVDYHTSEGAR